MKEIDLAECLNCTLPIHVCCGMPRQCQARYEKYLAKKAKDERNRNQLRTRMRKRRKQNEKHI